MNTDFATDDGLLSEMLGDFLDEADEIVSSLNENLLRLDEWVRTLDDGQMAHCDDDLMNEMFRSAHSLKGLSGMLALNDINALTHKVENVFDAARNDKLALTSEIVEVVFQSVDKLTVMIENLTESDAEPVDCEQVLDHIQRILEGKPVSQGQTPATAVRVQDVQAEPKTQSDDTNVTGNATDTVDHFANVIDEEDANAKYLAIFIDESEVSLEEMADALSGDLELISAESLMILCHKVKGSAASVGHQRAAKLAHFMEDLLHDILHTDLTLTGEMAEAMLRCTDTLREYVEGLRNGVSQTEGFNEVYGLLVAARPSEPTTATNSPKQISVPEADEQSSPQQTLPIGDESRRKIAGLAPDDEPNWLVQVVFKEGLPLPGLKATLVCRDIREGGTLFYCDPSEETLEDAVDLRCVTFGLSSTLEPAAIRNTIQIDGVERLDIERLEKVDLTPTTNDAITEDKPPTSAEAKPQETKGPEQPSSATKHGSKPTETLRVDIERLDHLMNLAGQLVINKARFTQIGEGLKCLTASKQASQTLENVFGNIDRLSRELDEADGKRMKDLDKECLRSQTRRIRLDLEHIQREVELLSQARMMVNDLAETVHQLDRVTDGIQKTVMDTRMVPIGPLFRRFKRVIRDITKSNGKDVQLVIRGENTELDKRMIDELGDPLIHMVRNCADHGIESPEDREAVGKPRQGTVTLDAFHRGNSILIEIRDDGKGLDSQKILDKAISKEIITASDAEKLSPHQIYQLIWEPGLSTAEKVTDISGRGMGMDIVRTKIEEINGTVELDSKVGEGTTITVKLPLTLAILPSLLVEIDGDVIAMPVESVSEIVPLNEEDLSTVHGLETASVRGRVISVINLSDLFCWNQPSPGSQIESDSVERSLVILAADGTELGLVVDRLLGEEDIVIKSMAENYRNVDGIAGASILGNGKVSLILDVGAVLEMTADRGAFRDSTKEFAK